MNPTIASHLRLQTRRSFPSTLRNLHVSQYQVLRNFYEGELEKGVCVCVFFLRGQFCQVGGTGNHPQEEMS
jgi:hypothetical protein